MSQSSAFFRAIGSLMFMLGLAACNVAVADPRPIELRVDAREAPRRLFHAKLTIRAKPGPMTLVYPKWIPGEHAPNGPIAALSGLKIFAGDKPVTWERDDVDMYAFHITVPDGADAIDVAFDYLAPSGKGNRFSDAPPTTPNVAIVLWYMLVVYPQGVPVHDLPVHAQLTVPEGWKVGTALPIEVESGSTTTFQTASLEMLADSPALCGRFFKEIPLGTKAEAPHSLVLASDSPEGLQIKPELVAQYQKLVAEAHSLFGARHYRAYRFLLSLSDQIGGGGIEHHESSDDRLEERYFADDKYRKLEASFLPHEYTHSWNGKYRRPAGMATPDYQEPMKTRLLWVYEGLTDYLGFVLAGRSGLDTPEMSQENFAVIADWAKRQAAQPWRPLVDTAVAAPYQYAAHAEWSTRRRGVDFYEAGALVWLDADTLIREKTDGKKSLDDFCKAFYGGADGPPEVKPYSFEDVVTTLNGVVPYDWKAFFDSRLNTADAPAPLDGLARSGWQLVYSDKPGEMFKAKGEQRKQTDLRSSLGFTVSEEGAISDVVPMSPADKAGVGPGMQLMAVNERKLNSDRLKQAVAATKEAGKITLLVEDGDYLRTIVLDYDGGARYPHLERVPSTPDRLSDIFKSSTTAAK
jgi:predicted metalloprotease with PDZ domain